MTSLRSLFSPPVCAALDGLRTGRFPEGRRCVMWLMTRTLA